MRLRNPRVPVVPVLQCMVRPCVARSFDGLVVERSCIMYPAFDWSTALQAIIDISARAISLTDRPQVGQLGHQGSHAPGRPNLHFVSSYISSELPSIGDISDQVLLVPLASAIIRPRWSRSLHRR